MSKKLFASMLLAAGVCLGMQANQKSSTVDDQDRWAPVYDSEELSPVDVFIDSCLSARTLLDLAASHTYESSDKDEKKDLVETWCRSNAPQALKSLSPDDRSFAIRRIKTQLDNLLVERAFDDGPSEF